MGSFKNMKKFFSLVIGEAVFFLLFLIPASSQAGLNVGVFTGYYLPSFGRINRQLVQYYDNVYGTNLKLRDGLASGVQVELEFSSGLKIRVENFSFKAITQDSYSVDSAPYRQQVEHNIKVTTNPFFISGIWDVSLEESFSLYLGCGIGIFPTEVRLLGTTKYYSGSTLVSQESWADWQRSDPMGFQYLGGFRHTFKGGLTISGEMRIFAVLLADLDNISTSVDWDGSLFSLAASYRF
jgi:opacity protein-like surface antigen